MKNNLKVTASWYKLVSLIILSSFFVSNSNAQNIKVNFTGTQLANLNSDVSLNIYPNPAADEAKLVFTSSDNGQRYEMRIINNSGQQLKEIKGTSVQGQNVVDVHVGNYPPGVYYVQLLTVTGRETLKFLKQPLNTIL